MPPGVRPSISTISPPAITSDGLGIVRAVHRDEAELGERLDQDLTAQVALLARDEARRTLVRWQAGPARV